MALSLSMKLVSKSLLYCWNNKATLLYYGWRKKIFLHEKENLPPWLYYMHVIAHCIVILINILLLLYHYYLLLAMHFVLHPPPPPIRDCVRLDYVPKWVMDSHDGHAPSINFVRCRVSWTSPSIVGWKLKLGVNICVQSGNVSHKVKAVFSF